MIARERTLRRQWGAVLFCGLGLLPWKLQAEENTAPVHDSSYSLPVLPRPDTAAPVASSSGTDSGRVASPVLPPPVIPPVASSSGTDSGRVASPVLPPPVIPPAASSSGTDNGQVASPVLPPPVIPPVASSSGTDNGQVASPVLPPPVIPPVASSSGTDSGQAVSPVLPPPVIPPVASTPLSQVAMALSVAEMGQIKGLILAGGQSQSGIRFTLPSEQVVTSAVLQLRIQLSPTLAMQERTLQLVLNGQPLRSLSLHKSSEEERRYQIEIPAAMVVANNNLGFILSGGNSQLCEKEGETVDEWVTILPTTQLQLESQILDIGHDLSIFPHPFFDPLLMKESRVSVSFSSSPKTGVLNAAALVASYLGLQSSFRDINFPVQLNALPEQHGIVFAMPGEVIGKLVIPATEGPQLQLIDNPTNPLYKLLVVSGRNEEELRQAAYRLASGNLPVKSASLAVKTVNIPVRKPYDAPRWINTKQPVHLRDMVARTDELAINGIYHDGVRIAFRAAPDLFMWDGSHIPVELGYRFPTESWIDEGGSVLNASINSTFLRSLPVNRNGLIENLWHWLGGDTRQERYRLMLPPYLIYGDNQLEFYFSIKPKSGTPCHLLSNSNIKSRIDPDSTIDLSRSFHFSQLPNLSFYVGAAFPYSRLADFSQTLLLLPEQPGAAEISMLLNLIARAGKATGVPVSQANLQLGMPADEVQAVQLRNKDILVVSSLEHTALYQPLLSGSPFRLSEEGALTITQPSLFDKLKSYLQGDWFRQYLEADRYLDSTRNWRGFLSFRSHWDPQRVVVVVTGSSDDEMAKIHTDLQLSALNAGIRGDLAIITDENGVHSFRVDGQFPSGEMPWHLKVMWYASQHIVTLALVALLVAVLLGRGLYTQLRARAAQRLGYEADHDK